MTISQKKITRQVYDHLLFSDNEFFNAIDIAVSLDIMLEDIKKSLVILQNEHNVLFSNNSWSLTKQGRQGLVKNKDHISTQECVGEVYEYILSLDKEFFGTLEISYALRLSHHIVVDTILILESNNKIHLTLKGYKLTEYGNSDIKRIMDNSPSQKKCTEKVYEFLLEGDNMFFSARDISDKICFEINNVVRSLKILQSENKVEFSTDVWKTPIKQGWHAIATWEQDIEEEHAKTIHKYMISSHTEYFTAINFSNELDLMINYVKVALVFLQFNNIVRYSETMKGWTLTEKGKKGIKV